MHKNVVDASVVSNAEIKNEIYRLIVHVPTIAAEATPGQFLQVRIDCPWFLLRRPFGVASVDAAQGNVTMFYRVVGRGTNALTQLSAGDVVNILGPLGHGFQTTAKHPLLIGGGMGLAPLLYLAETWHGAADVLIGGRNESEVFWAEFFRPVAHDVFITTDDGSVGEKGFTTTLLPMLLAKTDYDAIYVCGPEIMMRKIAETANAANVPCQVSLEKRMACGMGACLSCSIDTTDGRRKKVCKDGPVFWAQEVF